MARTGTMTLPDGTVVRLYDGTRASLDEWLDGLGLLGSDDAEAVARMTRMYEGTATEEEVHRFFGCEDEYDENGDRTLPCPRPSGPQNTDRRVPR